MPSSHHNRRVTQYPTRREFVTASLGAGLAVAGMPLMRAKTVDPPMPYGPLPSPRQLQWHAMEFYGFLHFTVNTFTDAATPAC